MLYVHRLPNQFAYQAPTQDWDMSSPEEQYYRQVAAEHRRQAEAATALAQQEHQRALLARRQQALRRESPFGFRSPYNARARPASCCHSGPSMEDLYFASYLEEQKRQAEERKRKEREEALRQLRHSQAHSGPSDFLFGLLSALGQDEAPASPNPAPSKKVRFNPSVEAQPAKAAVADGEPVPASKVDKGKAKELPALEPMPAQRGPQDAWTGLFNALSGGRSVQEREAILRDLGMKLPTAPKPAGAPAQPSPAPVPTRVQVPVTEAPKPSAPAPSSPRHFSFTAIDSIQSQFDALKASFTFPATLEFDSAGKLTYTPANAPVHAYESELMKLLTKLDGIDSEGAASIRGARKALVLAVEGELEKLDEDKKAAWEAQGGVKDAEAAPAAEAIEVDVAEPVAEVVAPTVEDSTTSDDMVVESSTATVKEPTSASEAVAEEPTSDATAVDQHPTSDDMVTDSIEQAASIPLPKEPTVEAVEPVSEGVLSSVDEHTEKAVEEVKRPQDVILPEVEMEVEVPVTAATEHVSEPDSPARHFVEVAEAAPVIPQPATEQDELVDAFSRPSSPSLSDAPSDSHESSSEVEDSVVVEAPGKVEEKQADEGSENDFEML